MHASNDGAPKKKSPLTVQFSEEEIRGFDNRNGLFKESSRQSIGDGLHEKSAEGGCKHRADIALEYGTGKAGVPRLRKGGIGATFTIKKDVGVKIQRIKPGYDSQGVLQKGDQVLSIDGITTDGMTVKELSRSILGPVGSEVTLLIRRQGMEQPFEVTVIRYVSSESNDVTPESSFRCSSSVTSSVSLSESSFHVTPESSFSSTSGSYLDLKSFRSHTSVQSAGIGVSILRPGAAGSRVKRVKKGSHAALSGCIVPGDVIVSVDGISARNATGLNQLLMARVGKIGSIADVEVLRKDGTRGILKIPRLKCDDDDALKTNGQSRRVAEDAAECAFEALKSLSRSYDLLRVERAKLSNNKAPMCSSYMADETSKSSAASKGTNNKTKETVNETAGFASLIEKLQERQKCKPDIHDDVDMLMSEAVTLEAQASKQMQLLEDCQRQIQVDLTKGVCDEDGLNNKVKHRDCVRTQACDVQKSILHKFLDAVTKCRTPTQNYDLERGKDMIQKRVDETKQKSDAMVATLDTATQSMMAYNARVGQVGASMGCACQEDNSSLACSVTTDLCSNALAGLEAWKRQFEYRSAADATDSLFHQLVEHIRGDALSALLCPDGLEKQSTDGQTNISLLKAAFQAAGMAVDNETRLLCTDAMLYFPARQLLSAGRAVAERAASDLKLLMRIQDMYGNIFQQYVLCLKGSQTEYILKNKAVEVMIEAKRQHSKAKGLLAMHTVLQSHPEVAQDQGLDAQMVEEGLKERREVLKAASSALCTSVCEMLNFQDHFPEVVVHVKNGLPQELVGLWRNDLTLEIFQDVCILETDSKHTVYKAVRDGKTSALKEYRMCDEQQRKGWMKEAALLHRMRHHSIISITGIFEDHKNKSLLLQMPYYEHGTLDVWVLNQVPGWQAVRSVLCDVLSAMAHLHNEKVVHCDVKPANILVSGQHRGLLADFDISVDACTRTCNRFCTTRLGYTPGYDAPELGRTGSTCATDMFSFGQTIASVKDSCARSNDDSADTDSIINCLKDERVHCRLTAEQAEVHAFFDPVKEAHKVTTEECYLLLCKDCAGGRIPACNGVYCSAKRHFMCASCLEFYALESIQPCGDSNNAILTRRNGGKIFCPHCLTESPRVLTEFGDAALAKVMTATSFDQYVRVRMALLEDRLRCELEKEVKERLESELKRLAAMDERQRRVIAARKHVQDDILQMKCPSCHAAFYDFDGCFSLTCSRCPKYFCGWCLEFSCSDWGQSHQHVAGCASKRSDIGSEKRKDFEDMHKQRCNKKLKSYLAGLDVDVREELIRDLRKVLAERGLTL